MKKNSNKAIPKQSMNLKHSKKISIKIKEEKEANENKQNEPNEPNEPSDYILLTKNIINNTTFMNDNDIKEAISRILEITTSQEISNIPD